MIVEKYDKNLKCPFKVKINQVEGALYSCILVQSGKSDSFEYDRKDAMLFQSIIKELNDANVNVIQIDFPKKEKSNGVSTSKDIENRTFRLNQVLRDKSLQRYFKKYVLIGLSLGTLSILQFLTQEPDMIEEPLGVLLISCVVENPTMIIKRVQEVHLLYGENDYIAYVKPETDSIEPISPHEYGLSTKKKLVILPSQNIYVKIFDSENHYLTNSIANLGNQSPPIQYILKTIKNIFNE